MLLRGIEPRLSRPQRDVLPLYYNSLNYNMPRPGIEPGATAWKAVMLPLHHQGLI